jgi:NitT/TauT family transport system substrate-binding protein
MPARTSRILIPILLCAALAILAAAPAAAAGKEKFRIAWSIYVGWMPWGYAADAGIVDRWADKYGIDIEVVQINDYIESINQYTAGAFAGCTMTNMDALTIPAAGGVDSTALIVGDFSNGNDAVLLKGRKELKQIKGLPINLVELSVSHYLLARALESVGLTERDIRVVNTSDADIVGAYATPQVQAVVTWNPQKNELLKQPDTYSVFDSSAIPGEIIDLLVVNTATLEANPALGKALVGAWYETLAILAEDGERGRAARAAMAKAAGTDLAGFEAQLATTRMFYRPAEAAAFARAPELRRTMDQVRSFSFAHGLLGEGAASPDVIGIAFPGGEVLGDAGNVKLRFDARYQQLAADGGL